MRLGLFAATALVLVLFTGNTALACDCVTADDPFASADVVFQGELIGIRRAVGTNSFESITYTFSVDRTMKGPIVKTVDLVGGENDCDMKFVPNAVYIVYANNHDGKLRSSSCSASQIIGMTQLVRTDPNRYVMPWERWFMNALGACGLGVLLGSAAFLWRRYVTKSP